MKCVREMDACPHLINDNCIYKEGCQPVIDKCEGCARVDNGYCDAYPEPELKWKNGDCNLATNIVREVKAKKKINPIKASRRRK